MKWQWIAWAFYLVVISFVPCSEGNASCNETAALLQQETDPCADDDCATGQCSPFCCCFCCHTQFAAEQFSHPSVPVIQVKDVPQTGYIPSLHPVHYGNIWQPPKIATV